MYINRKFKNGIDKQKVQMGKSEAE